MLRYRKNIKSGILRVPKEFHEAVGDEVELAPNYLSMAVYPANADKKKVIRSLKLIIKELEQELEV